MPLLSPELLLRECHNNTLNVGKKRNVCMTTSLMAARVELFIWVFWCVWLSGCFEKLFLSASAVEDTDDELTSSPECTIVQAPTSLPEPQQSGTQQLLSYMYHFQ